MILSLYNTESRTLEEIHPLDGNTVRIYTCGPTIYDFAHIGNLRTYTFSDLLRRSLKYFGYRVRQVMNLTDVEDKTIKGAQKANCSLTQYTNRYKKAFFEDLNTLHIEPVEEYPEATGYIDSMIQMIQTLLEKKVAYSGKEGSVYFNIEKFPDYGRLSHLDREALKLNASERIHSDEYQKENASDFVLWKHYDKERDLEVFWESPFGRGRPGWHIECSAMARALLGDTLDIHVGGVDLIFPHHENEIAQSEACSGKCFVNHWVHSEHLLVEHKKMSKSLGNFYTLRDLLAKGYSGEEIRYFLLQAHYRTQLNFTFQGLESARASLRRCGDFIERLQAISGTYETDPSFIEEAREEFKRALSLDLNISTAFAILFEVIRKGNTLMDEKKLGAEGAEEILKWLKETNQIFACLPLNPQELEIPSDLKEALVQREKARALKDWKSADYYRNLIISRGFIIEDTSQGARLKLKPIAP